MFDSLSFVTSFLQACGVNFSFVSHDDYSIIFTDEESYYFDSNGKIIHIEQ